MKDKILFALFFLLLTNSCAFGQKPQPAQTPAMASEKPAKIKPTSSISNVDTFTIENYSFSLESENDKCVLSYKVGEETKELMLDIPAPCRAVRELPHNTVTSYKYRNIGNATVFIVAGELTRNEKLNKDCGRKSQAVLVRRRSVTAGGTESQMGVCTPGGHDEKVYWFLSHP